MEAKRNVDENQPGIFQSEMALWVGILTTLVFLVVGNNWLMDLSNPLKYGFIFIWLFVVMLWLSFGVVPIAEKSDNYAFQLDYIKYDGDLPDADDQDAWRFNFQPSIPYPLGKGVNFFLRPLFPVILDQPVFEDEEGDFESKGVDLGNISFDAAIGKSFPSGTISNRRMPSARSIRSVSRSHR